MAILLNSAHLCPLLAKQYTINHSILPLRCCSSLAGFIKNAESLPVLLGVPLTGFLNEYTAQYGRAGYYLCATAALVAAVGLFFVGHSEEPRRLLNDSTKYSNGSVMSRNPMSSECGRHSLSRSYSLNLGNNHWPQSPYTTVTQTGYCGHCHYNTLAPYYHPYYTDQPGRLQKSYSFAFQTLPQDAYIGAQQCTGSRAQSR